MPRGLVLASRDEHAWRDGAFEVAVAPVVVGDEALLNPLQTVLVAAQRKARRVVQVQGHPAVPHEPEVVANAGAHFGQLGNVGVHTVLALGRAVVQWHLAADEAELLHGLLPDLAEQVIEGEVNSTDGVEDDPLAAIEKSREVHLVPDALNIGHQCALQEARQVLLDDPGTDLAGGCDAEAHAAIGGLNLNDKGAQDVDTKAAAAVCISRVLRHRGGDVVVDPVVPLLVVVVGAAFGCHGERTNLGDLRHTHQVLSTSVSGVPPGKTRILLALLWPLASSVKLASAPSNPTRPSISLCSGASVVPTHAAVSAKCLRE